MTGLYDYDIQRRDHDTKSSYIALATGLKPILNIELLVIGPTVAEPQYFDLRQALFDIRLRMASWRGLRCRFLSPESHSEASRVYDIRRAQHRSRANASMAVLDVVQTGNLEIVLRTFHVILLFMPCTLIPTSV